MIRVSIITPLHNKGPYIEATLRSVLAQHLAAWEMIVIENGSTDNGPALAASFAARDQRIIYLESTARGPGAARNAGLDRATGEWVLFLDADDLIDPGYLDERLGAALACPEAGIIAGPWTEFTDGLTDSPSRSVVPASFRRTAVELTTEAVASAPWVLHAALVRRSLLHADHRWPEALDRWPSEDAAFWFPLVTSTRTAWAEGQGAAYRLGTPSSRDRRDDVGRRTAGLLAVIDHNTGYLQKNRLNPSSGQVATLIRVLERAYLECTRVGQHELAAAALAAAQRWLRHDSATGYGIHARRLLGIPLFNRLTGRSPS